MRHGRWGYDRIGHRIWVDSSNRRRSLLRRAVRARGSFDRPAQLRRPCAVVRGVVHDGHREVVMLCGSGRAVIGVIAMAIAIMAGTAGAATAPATSRPRPAATPVLRPAFSRVGHAGWVWAGSRYTL